MNTRGVPRKQYSFSFETDLTGRVKADPQIETWQRRSAAAFTPAVILVEGLFDYAVLWQAGFRNVTCSLGTHLNARQFRQLCDGPQTVYLAFDTDRNGSGQRAAESLACRLTEQGVILRTVALPDGHDPNSFFVQDGDARQFRSLLEAAQ